MKPFFLSGSAGELFCVYHAPRENTEARGDLIFVPPFAEELNQSRHTVVRMARHLAARGWGVLLLDLFGTGDSQGQFEECRWQIWREDVTTARDWLRVQGRNTVGLWGLRLGGLLAADVAFAHPGLFTRLILWEPVTSGKSYLNQFLRIRTVGALIHGSGSGETTEELRRRLASGQPIAVAGYTLPPELARELESVDIAGFLPEPAMPALWFHVVKESPSELPTRTRELLDQWRKRGADVTSVPVVDEPFWSIQALEPLVANRLISATAEAL